MAFGSGGPSITYGVLQSQSQANQIARMARGYPPLMQHVCETIIYNAEAKSNKVEES